jgi:hypothetical protein
LTDFCDADDVKFVGAGDFPAAFWLEEFGGAEVRKE